jgi:hypothetical protein
MVLKANDTGLSSDCTPFQDNGSLQLISYNLTTVRRKLELLIPREHFFAQHCAKMKDDHKTEGKKTRNEENEGRRIKNTFHHPLSFSFLAL